MSTSDIRDAQIDDGIQHGIDDNPHDDAKKGAALGGIGGAAVGAAAGAMVGPIGAVIGAVVGGVSGAAASGAAVSAIDDIDNDNNITGLGEESRADMNEPDVYTAANPPIMNDPLLATTAPLDPVVADDRYAVTTPPLGSEIPGGLSDGRAGGHAMDGRAVDGTPDTRGLAEKAADAITGDPIDDKTGKPVAGAVGTTPRY